MLLTGGRCFRQKPANETALEEVEQLIPPSLRETCGLAPQQVWLWSIRRISLKRWVPHNHTQTQSREHRAIGVSKAMQTGSGTSCKLFDIKGTKKSRPHKGSRTGSFRFEGRKANGALNTRSH